MDNNIDLGAYNTREFQRRSSVGFHMLHQMESTMKGMTAIKKVLNEVMTTTALKNYLRRNKFMICAGDLLMYCNPGNISCWIKCTVLWARVYNVPFN